MSDTDRLIESMVRSLVPVRRIPPLRVALAGALAAGVVSAALWIGLYGARPDLFGPAPSWSANLVGIGLMAVGGLVAAIASSVPGRHAVTRIGLALAAVGLAVCAGIGGWVARGGPAGHPWWHGVLSCTGVATLLAIPVAVLALLWIAWTAPRWPVASAALAAVGSVALGASAIHVTCPIEDPLHALLWHALSPFSGGVLLWLALVSLRRLVVRHSA